MKNTAWRDLWRKLGWPKGTIPTLFLGCLGCGGRQEASPKEWVSNGVCRSDQWAVPVHALWGLAEGTIEAGNGELTEWVQDFRCPSCSPWPETESVYSEDFIWAHSLLYTGGNALARASWLTRLKAGEEICVSAPSPDAREYSVTVLLSGKSSAGCDEDCWSIIDPFTGRRDFGSVWSPVDDPRQVAEGFLEPRDVLLVIWNHTNQTLAERVARTLGVRCCHASEVLDKVIQYNNRLVENDRLRRSIRLVGEAAAEWDSLAAPVVRF